MVLAIDIGSCNAGFPSGGFSCAEALLQSLNLAERLPAKDSEVIPTMLSRSVSSPCIVIPYMKGVLTKAQAFRSWTWSMYTHGGMSGMRQARRLKLRSYATI